MGGKPHFTRDPALVQVYMAEGLNAVRLDGSGRRAVVRVVGPGWYFAEGPAPVDELSLSPDGRWALAQIAQQLHLLAVPPDGGTIDLSRLSVAHRKVTDVGADFHAWADGGDTVTWSVGSTFYRQPLAAIALDSPGAPARAGQSPRPGSHGVAAFTAVVEMPRDVPRGVLLLRGGTVITVNGDEVIEDADLLIVDDRIAAIGRRGEVSVPASATVRDIRGRYVVPGFIDAHTHIADVRRVILDLQSWGPLASLAYGVTTAFDPSPLSIDMLAYEDLIDTGQMPGARIHSTGPALFSFNTFASQDEVRAVLSRYRDHYRVMNLKQYRTGNRQVRRWIADSAREMGLMPTCEGALSMKLNLTQVLDGFSGIEHALTAAPLGHDVVELVARSRTSYTATLSIGNGGPPAQDYFIVRDRPRDDPKLNRFAPSYVVDVKMQQRMWREESEYLFPSIAAGVAGIRRAGGLIAMGSHGETPGLGFHWEMQAHAMGGMTPAEVLRAATLGSAEAIGRQQEFGSIEAGKYADLVILEADPLRDIGNALAIEQVMKNGRLYDADTMDEIWPRQLPLAPRWFWNDDLPMSSSGQSRQVERLIRP
jgi:imidazolonepropionase-like amidohydrolase